ncbi:taurine ABC transporter substrate-binding protein [Chromobacterium sphagni]|uniref:Taurine ABC transporter substrate-binding protein n=1 Tax=Chromobacterium sphagni TaxID=1903179 RepID=A0A1S1WXU6_9NEIS|nr:taurine ABC transporter substrate-binding protein [Chromobacterium sphagni]OHX11753.1 taurine ABC transporter substrate-binding protein [Chromobacterium sphagni]OHX20666.1 taurine ABC transporter substrate-binding protein [Chromobacterium sphagni]
MAKPRLLSRLFLSAALLLAGAASAADIVTIGYQTGIDPTKIPQADGAYEKATGSRIHWRKFESGAELIAALASGDVAIGNIGSSPLAAAASRGLAIQTFLVADEIGSAEALVARSGSGIAKPQDLVGKKVAVPFVSTTHYSLLAALKHWNIDAAKVNVLNLRPGEITAAWQRGDIDAAYVWDPALGKLKAGGKVLATSRQVAEWGAPTYDIWVVRQDFAAKHPEFVSRFAKVSLDAIGQYLANPQAFIANADNIAKIGRLTGAAVPDVVAGLRGNRFLSRDEQAALLQSPFVQAVGKTAAFLKAQGKVDALQADYGPYVTNRFVKTAR